MPKLYLFALFLFVTRATHAQDTMLVSQQLSKQFSEKFAVLTSDSQVKQGFYHLYSRTQLVAAGRYINNKKTGVWNYYDSGKIVQQYNFDSNKLLFDIPEKNITCKIANAKKKDNIQNPVKLGGSIAGYRFITTKFSMPANLAAPAEDRTIEHHFDVDETGKLTGWQIVITTQKEIKRLEYPVETLSDDQRAFIPAQLNGKPVSSVVIYRGISSIPFKTDIYLNGTIRRNN